MSYRMGNFFDLKTKSPSLHVVCACAYVYVRHVCIGPYRSTCMAYMWVWVYVCVCVHEGAP